MNGDRWQRVKHLVGEAMALETEARQGFVEQSCHDDPELQHEVQSLLASHDRAGTSFLNQPAAALSQQDGTVPGTAPGYQRTGPYQIIEEIGHGGMGEVYRAVRADGQYTKEVAIKLVQGGSRVLLERFRHERQILASLDHFNIARLLDGGTTDGGVPYLVMELIQGTRIDQYCEQQKLALEERLRLFLQVCDAVQFAHHRLIIHRDIKPGNILVTREGVPKLLDFGIAKILEDTDAGQADSTLTAFRLLTPQYASPEQIRGEPITTASDVYSLGVVLYELLTGQSPYPTATGGPHEAARLACEFEPSKPSTAVRSGRRPRDKSHSEAIAPQMVPAEKLAKQLKGDLDHIILKALRKEPQRRYASPEQFAEDIRRTLAHVPVLARKDSARYRTAKFIRRHKVGVAAAATIATVLLAALVVTLREARIAERRFNDVRSLANSLIFDVHDSIKDLPGSTPARKIIVDRALQYLNGLARESAGDIALQRELATAYEKVGKVQGDYLQSNLGDTQGALASYEKARAIRQQIERRSQDWRDRLALAQAYRLVAHQRWVTGDAKGGRDEINRAIALAESLLAAHPNDPKALYESAFDYEVSGEVRYPGDPLEQQKVTEDYHKALAADEAALKIQPDDVQTLHGYAVDLTNIGKLLEPTDARGALSYFERALEVNQNLTKRSTEIQYVRSVAAAYSNIADIYADLGDFARASDNNKQTLAIYQQLSQADPRNALVRQGLAIAYVNTASALSRAGGIKESIWYATNGLQMMRELVASAPQNRAQKNILAEMLVSRGTILTAAKQPEAAIESLEQARAAFESLAASDDLHLKAAACDVKLGEAAAAARRDQAAATYFRRALSILEPLITIQDPELEALYAAADAYSGLGDLSLKGNRRDQVRSHAQSNALNEARSWYEKSSSAWKRIKHPNGFTPNGFRAGDPATVAWKLKKTEVARTSVD